MRCQHPTCRRRTTPGGTHCPTHHTYSPPTKARHHTTCPACHQTIHPGDTIRIWTGHGATHNGCTQWTTPNNPPHNPPCTTPNCPNHTWHPTKTCWKHRYPPTKQGGGTE